MRGRSAATTEASRSSPSSRVARCSRRAWRVRSSATRRRPERADTEVYMSDKSRLWRLTHAIAGLVLAAGLAGTGCASHKHELASDSLKNDAPYSRTFAGSGETVCWSVKRALLSQGYMLDRPSDSGVLTGARDFQPEPKLNVTVRLQASCADNKDGT